MQTLRQSLPALNALLVFEAAARHCSFTAAAAELCIAQSAVSRHITGLERHTGLQLFNRKGNRIKLTATGQALAAAVAGGLGSISSTLAQLTSTARGVLTIGCSHDMAQSWLMPRFEIINSRVPGHQVRLLTATDYQQLDRADIDLSIRFGLPSDWPGFHSVHLFDGAWFPVCAPALLARFPALASDAEALRVAPLLHLISLPDESDSWASWLGVSKESLQGPVFTSYLAMLQAAVAGHGIALAWSGFVEQQLRRSELVRITNEIRTCPQKFYLVLPKGRESAHPELLQALLESVAVDDKSLNTSPFQSSSSLSRRTA